MSYLSVCSNSPTVKISRVISLYVIDKLLLCVRMIEVWVYKGRKTKLFKWQYKFFKNLVGNIMVKGNKRVRLSRLLSLTKFEERNPIINYSNPTKIYTFDDQS